MEIDADFVYPYSNSMKNLFKRALALVVGVFVTISNASDLSTVAEKTQWVKTGRSDETEKLCHLFAKKFPKYIACKSYGKTPEGRTMWYMVIKDPSDKVMSSRSMPVVWVQAGIHAGEIDGKDAMFLLLKDVFERKINSDLFSGVTVVFVPIVNLDGHERFGKWNRPNQVGPEEMGWRTTAQNYNMNRDFAKVDAEEMRALNQLWNKYDPIVSLDLHVTDGAHFQPEMGIIVTPTTHSGSTALHKAGKELEAVLVKKMTASKHLVVPFYPSFEKEDQPLSGFSRNVSPPRFANGYWFVRNRLGVLIESHSWKDYATRVRAHYDVVVAAIEATQRNGVSWLTAAKDADAADLAGKSLDVSFKHTEQASRVDFGGYKFSISQSKISGADVIRYFTDQPEVWNVPLYEELVPSVTVGMPLQGYFIPSSEMQWMRAKLDVHNIKYKEWKKSLPERAYVFRASQVQLSTTSFEGRQTATVEGKWMEEKVEWPKKMFFVSIKQPSARIAAHLLEPLAPDSFVHWGFFNRFFELKEYMEDYVTEDVATTMLANNKSIAAEFKEKLKDESFAKDPAKRFRFFFQKHTSWDDRYNRYPVFKL